LNKYLKFSNRDLTGINPIQKLLYILAYPIAKISSKFGLTPNILTLISFIFTIFAFISLVKNYLLSFILFWFVAFILDYADGTLARMTSSKGKTALRYDHISDLLKISLIFLGFGLYYDNQLIWILTFSSAVLFLFYTVLNHELDFVLKITALSTKSLNIKLNKDKKKKLTLISQIKLLIKKKIFLKNFILTFLSVFFYVNGHTLLIFFFIPLNFNFAIILLTYFILITIFHSIQRAKILNKLKKIKK